MEAIPVEGVIKASMTCTMYAFSLVYSQNQRENAQRDAGLAGG